MGRSNIRAARRTLYRIEAFCIRRRWKKLAAVALRCATWLLFRELVRMPAPDPTRAWDDKGKAWGKWSNPAW